jgi:hypothetical protein
MSCIHITLIVAEKEKGNRPEPRKQPSEDTILVTIGAMSRMIHLI